MAGCEPQPAPAKAAPAAATPAILRKSLRVHSRMTGPRVAATGCEDTPFGRKRALRYTSWRRVTTWTSASASRIPGGSSGSIWGPLVVTALIAAVIVGVVNVVVGLAVGGSIGVVNAGSFTGLAVGSALFSMVLLMVVAVVVYAWMYAVTFRMILRRVRERRAADYADLQSFDQIGAFAVAAVILGVIIVIPGLILTTIWLYALPLIGDRRIGVSEAMSESKDMAARPGYFTTFVTWLVGAIVVGVIVGILSIIPVVGVILGLVAAPFGVAYVLSMYFQARGEGHLVDAAIAQAPAPRGAGG